MRIKWTVLLYLLMISGLALAQNTANTSFQVKGILLDSLTQEGEPYATRSEERRVGKECRL